MKKSEAIKAMGLTKYDRDIIHVGKFDVPQSEVTRDIYIDGRGDEWVWLWGEFYRCEKGKRSLYGYTVL